MSYENLQVYQRAHTFGVACHRASVELPKYELYECAANCAAPPIPFRPTSWKATDEKPMRLTMRGFSPSLSHRTTSRTSGYVTSKNATPNTRLAPPSWLANALKLAGC